MTSIEQQARDLLDRMEVDGAQNFSSGELVELAELISERNQLARQVDTMIEKGVEDGLGLKSLHVEDGESHLSVVTTGVAERTVLTMLDGLADMLGDATNYVEFDLKRRGKTPVSVCVRRYAHPTPHDLRVKAEKERDTLAAEVARLRAQETRIRELCRDTGEYQARAKHIHAGSARLLAVEILAALDAEDLS